jgi:N6-adenosine-specific RNA methylase IME4
MSNEDIAAMPIKDIAADDAVLFLWSTSAHLAEAMKVIDAWGFTYKSQLIWNKGNIGWGYYFRGQHELLLLATRGSPGTPPASARFPSVLNSPRCEHSQKPDEVYTMIEKMYPDLPKLELFARGAKRPGWASWGNEVTRDYNPKILKRYFVPAARAV